MHTVIDLVLTSIANVIMIVLRIRVELGSPASQILTLVGLDILTVSAITNNTSEYSQNYFLVVIIIWKILRVLN